MIRPVFVPDGTETEGAGQDPASQTGEGGEEDGVAAGKNGEISPDAPPASDDGAPVGPGEGEEAAFLAEQRIASGVAAAPAREREIERDEGDAAGSLPPLDDLVNRIPAPTRALMDELFRAKFITVKRVPKSALK